MKRFFSVIAVVAMCFSVMLGSWLCMNTVVRFLAQDYQEYNGYLQNDQETQSTLIWAADYAVNGTLKTVSKTEEVKDGLYDTAFEMVLTSKNAYFELDGSGEMAKYPESSEIVAEQFFEDKNVAFHYDGEEAYIKYADGQVRKYYGSGLEDIKTAFSKLVTTYGYEQPQLYIWVDSDIYAQCNRGLAVLENVPIEKQNVTPAILSFILAVTLLVLSLLLASRSQKTLARKERIYTEIPLIFLGAEVLAGVGILALAFDTLAFYYNHQIKIAACFLAAGFVLVSYLILRELILKIRERRFFRDFFLAKVIKKIFGNIKKLAVVFLDKTGYRQFSPVKKMWIRNLLFFVFTILYTGVASIFIRICGMEYYYNAWETVQRISPAAIILVILVYLAALVFYSYQEMKLLQGLRQVFLRIEEISKGHYETCEAEEDSPYYEVMMQLNSLSGGMEEAVEKRISSEKMKVELITNVSHDLKTPLTSIISYVNLLKEEQMTETAAAYVKILEDKSYQLKNIVTDVFDLAKANSGQDVNIETLDGIMLIHQVLADRNDLVMQSGKMIKENIEPEMFMIQGDGKKLYRAISNLLENALKYSMEGTRIYLTSWVEEEKLHLQIKNIASYEMEFSGEDIVERFVRGDASRTTEGNGLGLSIAKSFIEVCGGTMEVKVDGDVFEVEIVFM